MLPIIVMGGPVLNSATVKELVILSSTYLISKRIKASKDNKGK